MSAFSNQNEVDPPTLTLPSSILAPLGKQYNPFGISENNRIFAAGFH